MRGRGALGVALIGYEVVHDAEARAQRIGR